MNKDAIAFLDGETVEEPGVEEAQVEEPVAEEQPEVEAETPQPVEATDEGAEAEVEEQTGETEGSTPEPEPQNDSKIPVTALLDEREKRQEAQRKAEEADRRARELQAQLQRMQQPKQEAPDWYEDPQAAAQFQSQTIEQQMQARMMQQSKFFAERDFGAETVNEALSYFDQHPEQSGQFVNHPSPFHAAVEYYKRQKTAAEIGSDPEAYKEKIRAELKAELEAQLTQNAAVAQPSKPKSPPPSVASAPAKGREAIVPGNAFDGMFPD